MMDAREFKPKWENAPEWAEYLAMDSDGSWWWHIEKPKKESGYWVSDSAHELAALLIEFTECFDWEKTLKKRPK